MRHFMPQRRAIWDEGRRGTRLEGGSSLTPHLETPSKVPPMGQWIRPHLTAGLQSVRSPVDERVGVLVGLMVKRPLSSRGDVGSTPAPTAACVCTVVHTFFVFCKLLAPVQVGRKMLPLSVCVYSAEFKGRLCALYGEKVRATMAP